MCLVIEENKWDIIVSCFTSKYLHKDGNNFDLSWNHIVPLRDKKKNWQIETQIIIFVSKQFLELIINFQLFFDNLELVQKYR